jgi:hypothetical protein
MAGYKHSTVDPGPSQNQENIFAALYFGWQGGNKK